jgi:DNA polymerase III subunit alpha
VEYVHLHVKSHYSMLHALATPSQLVSKASKIGQRAIALTDFGLCAGFPKFAESCKKAGIKPIFGMELFVVKNMDEKEKGDGSRRKSIVLIARTAEGYRNLLDISSESFMRGFYQKPRIDFAYLEKKSAGLICLTGGIYSHIPSMVWVNDMEKADKAMKYYKRLFGEWFFVEITRHPGVPEEEQVMKSMEELARRHGVRCVAANDVRYADKSDAEAHDVFTCLENTKCVKDEGRFRLKQPEYYLKTSEEMCALFADRPEYIQASADIAASIEITTIEEGKDCIPGAHISGDRSPSEFLRQLVFDGLKSKGLGNDERYVDRLEFELKVFDVCGYTLYFLVLWDFVANAKSKGIRVGPGRGSAAGSLALYVLDITKLDPIKYDLLFERFLSVDTAYHLEPADFGLSFDLPHAGSPMVDSKKLFEICSKHAEFNKEAFVLEGGMMRDRGVLETFYSVCDMFLADGRIGNRNKCNSRIAYWMGMTTAAPSDQFRPGEKMTSSRVSPPDVDMDFDFFRREEVYRYLIDTYGEEYTCNIGTYNALMVRATLRSVAKAMDLANDWVNGGKAGEGTLQMADDIAKMAEAKAKTIDEAAACNPELNQVLKKYPKYAEICRKIEGRISCGGIHAAGIVVSNRKVRELSPMRTSKATVCSQFDKDEMEHVGLLKFDILALTTLSIVDNAVKMIADRHHIDLDMDALEPDDQNVFKMLNAGITNGIFQMEGYGMTKLLSNMHVDSFEDMIAANAIYRPGPLGAKVDELYCDYKFGRKQIEYPHPSVEPVLKPTYGLIVYQEQVMNVAKAMAGFSSSQADKLRKAIGKKKMDIMAEMKEKFVAGCQANGITVAVANDTWDKIELFGGYGFNRSHAACYAFLAYQTAYLKRHYTIEFMCALMTANIGKDELVKYMIETRDRLQIKLYGPDVSCSKTSFVIEDGGIRVPLTHIKGVGDVAVQKIVNGQPYRDFRDFAERNTCREVNSRALSLLVEGGALSSFRVSKDEVLTYFEDLKKERKALKYDATAYNNAPSLMDMIMGGYRSLG